MTRVIDHEAVASVLRDARALIGDEERWTTGAYARKVDGSSCTANTPGACQWCAVGAVLHAGRSHPAPSPYLGSAAVVALVKAADELHPDAAERAARVTEINDHLGHAAILEVYDRAIRNTEEGRL